jgi:hypothetical protein
VMVSNSRDERRMTVGQTKRKKRSIHGFHSLCCDVDVLCEVAVAAKVQSVE